MRGGSWNNNRHNARAANRNDNHPDNRNDNNGFRVDLVTKLQLRDPGLGSSASRDSRSPGRPFRRDPGATAPANGAPHPGLGRYRARLVKLELRDQCPTSGPQPPGMHRDQPRLPQVDPGARPAPVIWSRSSSFVTPVLEALLPETRKAPAGPSDEIRAQPPRAMVFPTKVSADAARAS